MQLRLSGSSAWPRWKSLAAVCLQHPERAHTSLKKGGTCPLKSRLVKFSCDRSNLYATDQLVCDQSNSVNFLCDRSDFYATGHFFSQPVGFCQHSVILRNSQR